MNLMNNRFLSGINKVIDCIWLSLLWFLCSIPIITIGASTTALYYTMNKVIRNDLGYVAPQFFASFRKNFKQSTIVWLILLVVYSFLGYDYWIMKQAMSLGEEIGYIYHAFLVFMIIITLWGIYLFPYIARFDNTIKETFKNTLFIAILNLPWTILLGMMFFFAFILIYMSPAIVLVMPSFYHFFKNKAIEQVFRKYMSPEDLEAEQERIQNNY